MPTTTTAPPQFADALERWMDDRDLGGGSALSLAPLQGGSQNELWEIERGDRHLVLRCPPAGAAADRLEQFSREHRLLRALRDSAVPHARLEASCEDPAVIGSPFYLMQYVDGWSPTGQRTWPEPYGSDLSARPDLAFELVRGAALLSQADWHSPELEGFGRPEGFHDRQVDRWLAFLRTYQFRELPGLDEAAAWLREHRPSGYQPGIMHGDYQFANVMYANGAPARLAAVIDWEMATVGDPLLDLGWVLVAWGPEADDMEHARYLDLTGMPSRDDLLHHYATISGRPVDEIDYYVVLARFKLGIVLEKSVARSQAQGGGGYGEVFSPLVLELERKAAELSRTTSLR